ADAARPRFARTDRHPDPRRAGAAMATAARHRRARRQRAAEIRRRRGGPDMRELRRLIIGPPRDVSDPKIFHRVSLVAFLAWVGLGADGLSSSAYGPEEAYKALGPHFHLSIILVAMTAVTVAVISIAYSNLIQHFPGGGGGYLVATKLLGNRVGVVSGCALLVDYVLTITVSIASACDQIWSFLPPSLASYKLTTEFIMLIILVVLNLRGVKES